MDETSVPPPPPPLPSDIFNGTSITTESPDVLICNPASDNVSLMKFPTKLCMSIDYADNESISIITTFLEYANSRGGYNDCWAFGKKIAFLKNVLEHQFKYDGIFAR